MSLRRAPGGGLLLFSGPVVTLPPDPELTAPILAPMSATVLDSATIGTSVGTADLANSPNPAPTYSIEAGPVAIDSLTGAMTIDDTLAAGVLELDVTATNSEGFDTEVLTLTVNEAGEGVALTTLAATSRSGGTQSDAHLIFGLPLPADTLTAGSHIQAYLGASPLPTQTSLISANRRWCLVCVIASPGTSPSDLNLVVEAGDPDETQDITSAEFATWLAGDAGRETIATVEVDGVTYTANMADALGETGTYTHGEPHEVGRYVAGPYLNYLRLIVPLKDGSDNAHPALFIEFHPAIMSNGSGTISKVRTDALLCQTTLFGENQGNYLLDKWELTIGGVAVESWTSREPAANVTSISGLRGGTAHGTISISLSASVMTSLDVGAPVELNGGRGTVITQAGNSFTLQVPYDDDAYAQSQSVTSPANVNLNGLTLVYDSEARCRMSGNSRVRVQNTTATGCTLRFTRTTTAFAADTEDLVLVSGAVQYLDGFHDFSQAQCVAGSCTGLQIGYGGLESTSAVTSGDWKVYATKYLMGSRLRIRGWHGTPVDVHLAWDTDYLIDETKLLPPVDFARVPDFASTITADAAVLAALPQATATGSQKHLRPYAANGYNEDGFTLGFNHNTVGSAEWSSISRFAIAWLQYPSDPVAWDQFAVRAEASNWSTHFNRRDEATGLFVDINTSARWNHTQNPGYGTPGATQWYMANKHLMAFDTSNRPVNPWQYHTSFDGGHLEPIAETYYMMTGDLWAFENIVGSQQGLWASSNPAYRPTLNTGSSLNWQNNMTARPAANTVHQLGQMVALWPDSPDDVIGGKDSWKARLDFFQSSLYAMYVTPGPDLLGFYPYALGPTPDMRKGDFNHFQYSNGTQVIILFHQTYYGQALGRLLALGAFGSQGEALTKAQLGWILDSIDGGDWHPAHYGSMPAGYGLTAAFKPVGSLAEAYRALREDKYPNQVSGPSGSNAFSYTSPVATLTMSATGTGSRTATTNVDVFWPEHVGSFISPTSTANGLGTITAVGGARTATVNVTATFSSTSYASGAWRLGIPAPTATPTGLLGDRSQNESNNYLALLIGCVAFAKQIPDLAVRAQAAFDMLTGLYEDLNGATPYSTGTSVYAMRPY